MTKPRRFLTISKNGNSTVSVGNMYLVILIIRKGIAQWSEGITHISFCTHCLLSHHNHWKWPSTIPFALYFLVFIGISPHWRETKEAFQGVLERKKYQKNKTTRKSYLFLHLHFFWPKYPCSKLTAGWLYHSSVYHFCGQSWHITVTT